jgi:hypothetical protein
VCVMSENICQNNVRVAGAASESDGDTNNCMSVACINCIWASDGDACCEFLVIKEGSKLLRME